MRQANIGGLPCSVGLDWRLAESQSDVEARKEESGRERGVVLRVGQRVAGVGFADGDARNPPPSAAAMLALRHPDEAVCAIEWADADGGRVYWMAAVSGGAVVSGTDALFDDPDALRRPVNDLVADFGCRASLQSAPAVTGHRHGAPGRRRAGHGGDPGDGLDDLEAL